MQSLVRGIQSRAGGKTTCVICHCRVEVIAFWANPLQQISFIPERTIHNSSLFHLRKYFLSSANAIYRKKYRVSSLLTRLERRLRTCDVRNVTGHRFEPRSTWYFLSGTIYFVAYCSISLKYFSRLKLIYYYMHFNYFNYEILKQPNLV